MASDLQPPSSKSKVKLETIDKAVNALIKWKHSQSKSEKPQLLPQEDLIYLYVTLAKFPSHGGQTKPHKFPLPHPLLLHGSSSSEICLIIDDRPKSNLTSGEAKKKIKSEEIPVSKVLKFSKLKTDYKPFQKKRQLCDSYDLFLADRRIIPLLPKLLGKPFFTKKKFPLAVDLGHKNWKKQTESACSSGLLYLKTGTSSVMKVGKASMEVGEIIENVAAAIDGVIEIIPKKWSGLRALHLKFSDSLALPIYQSLPDVKLKIEGVQSNVEEEEMEVKEIEGKKDEKLGKKKGRIYEVRYMDASVDEAIDDDDVKIDSVESVGKKRKQSDSLKAKKKKKDEVEKPKAKLSKNEVLENAIVEKYKAKLSKDEVLKNAEVETKVENPKAKLRKNGVLKKAKV